MKEEWWEGISKKDLAITVGTLLDFQANRDPVAEALISSSERYSYQSLLEVTNQVAKGLLGIGVRKGEKVAILAANDPLWILVQFASAKLGSVLVPININWEAPEIEYLLRQSDSSYLFLGQEYRGSDFVKKAFELLPELDRGKSNSPRFPLLKKVIFLGKDQYPGMLNLEALLKEGRGVGEETLSQRAKSVFAEDLAYIQYTSAISGFPRGAMITHFGILKNASILGRNMRFTSRDHLCLPIPLHHIFAYGIGILAAFISGAKVILADCFNPLQTLSLLEKERCTAIYQVPTMFLDELNHPDFHKFDLSSLRKGVIAGAPCPIGLVKRIVKEMSIPELLITYGQTEVGPALTQTSIDDPPHLRYSTVGKALPGIEIKIVDPETGKPLPPGKSGELCAKSDMMMLGYYKLPAESSKVISENGWLHTGDLAMVDEKGYYKITGRLRDMIIRGGENIYLKEIEEFLKTHPLIEEVVIIGVPSYRLGEEVMAIIKLKEGVSYKEKEIRDYCKGKIARYKIPRYIKFVKDFPKNIEKSVLREEAIKELGLEEVASIETA